MNPTYLIVFLTLKKKKAFDISLLQRMVSYFVPLSDCPEIIFFLENQDLDEQNISMSAFVISTAYPSVYLFFSVQFSPSVLFYFVV